MTSLQIALALIGAAASALGRPAVSVTRTISIGNQLFYIPSEPVATLPIAPVNDEILPFAAISTNKSTISEEDIANTISSWESADDVFNDSFLQGMSIFKLEVRTKLKSRSRA